MSVNNVINICKSFHWAHGKPVHISNPNKIGILNIFEPDWGDAPRPLLEDEVNVFWACGVTPQMAIMAAKPKLCITHAPGCMLVLDTKNDQLAN